MRLLIVCIALACLHASGQVLLRINGAPPKELTLQELQNLPHQSSTLNEHGVQVNYEGVLLHDLLARNGVDFGKGLRGKALSTYVAVAAGDGYKVIYGLAEFDPTITNADILLADRREGKPLAANEGPLRVIVPGDRRPVRSVKMVREIAVVAVDK